MSVAFDIMTQMVADINTAVSAAGLTALTKCEIRRKPVLQKDETGPSAFITLMEREREILATEGLWLKRFVISITLYTLSDVVKEDETGLDYAEVIEDLYDAYADLVVTDVDINDVNLVSAPDTPPRFYRVGVDVYKFLYEVEILEDKS